MAQGKVMFPSASAPLPVDCGLADRVLRFCASFRRPARTPRHGLLAGCVLRGHG